jgi:SAM-dependent methyltransferase
MKIFETLDLTAPGVVLGNHGVWMPGRCIKVPFQWSGRVTKRTRREASYSRETIVDEVCILRALAELRMAPPVGDLVYFKNIVSDYPGAWHCDPCGAYGYEIADARSLKPGRYDVASMRAMWEQQPDGTAGFELACVAAPLKPTPFHDLPVEGSPGAWGDVAKPDNVVNGYLVDVRRTGWDLLQWKGHRFELPGLLEEDLAARVHRECQFPAGKRAEAYQDFYLDRLWHLGQRRVVERAELLGFAPRAGESVLEIGCQSGGFLQLGALAGAEVIGVEIDPNYIDCARALARSSSLNICIRRLDAVDEMALLLEWIGQRFPRGLDHLLALSMEKHLGEEKLFQLVDALGARRTYIETNAVSDARPMKLFDQVRARGGVHVGDSHDRNLRRLYRIHKES